MTRKYIMTSQIDVLALFSLSTLQLLIVLDTGEEDWKK